MRILVTGGAGFIGSNFVHYILRTYPLDELVILDKLTYAGNLRNLSQALQDNRCNFVRCDVGDPEVREIASHCDVAVHFAAESHVDRSIEDAVPFIQTNIQGTWRMIAACRASRIARFVHVSTDEVYGSLGTQGKFSETSPLAPTNPYAASKAASDLLVLSAIRTYGFPAIVTRSTNNYGPFQFPEKFIPLMIAQALANKYLPIYGNGRHIRDWIHVEDHCRALDLILRKGTDGEVYNISAECELENIVLARKILRNLQRPDSLLRFISDRPAHDRRYALNCDKLKKELGWTTHWNFEHGLEQTIQWYRENSGWLEQIRSGEYQSYFERHYTQRALLWTQLFGVCNNAIGQAHADR